MRSPASRPGLFAAARSVVQDGCRRKPRGTHTAWPVAGVWLVAVLASLLGSGPLSADQDPNQVKAEMLCNIAKFVQWPDAAFAQTKGQLVCTILGEDELAVALAVTLSRRSIGGHPVFVRCVSRAQDVKGSQILYIASSEQANVAEALKLTKGTAALTVADTEGFAARGGMVNFALIDSRVRFEINVAHAEQEGLKISSKVLALANVVAQNED